MVAKEPTQAHKALTWAALAMVIAVIAIWGIGAMRNAPKSQPAATFVVDTTKQESRRRIVDELVSKGYFHRVERPSDLPHLWVTPKFKSLNFDDKKTFVSVVFALYYPEAADTGRSSFNDIVIIKDSISGERIGTFSSLGLQH